MSVFQFLLNKTPRPLLIRFSYWVRPLLAFALRGTAYTDPIDGKSFRKMLSYGYLVHRKNALSPSTLSLERHRLLWLYLQRETDFFTENNLKKLLHIAPEQCFWKRFQQMKNLEYTTCDLESPIADVKADICDLPFADATFDILFCNHVLEHIPDDIQAMKELFRVLKRGGYGIFQVPQDLTRNHTYEDPQITCPKEREEKFGQYDHVRIYGQDYFERLRSVGFKVTEVAYTKILSKEEIQRYALVNGEIIPICYKR